MQIPIIFYPLTIICVDDKQIVLDVLKSSLSSQCPIVTFSSPVEALSEISNWQDQSILEDYLKNVINKNESDNSELQLQIKVAQLVELSKISNRHNEPGIVISDYRMPEIDGIEFCKKISHLNLKKILLTEFEDTKQVFSAFNANVINRFLLKTATDLMTQLNTWVKELTREYFVEKTKQLRENIEIEGKLPLSDRNFEKLFLHLVEEMNIQEYYLIDKNGSFLLINSKNEQFDFIVHTEASLDEFTKLYNEPDCKIFADQIARRKKIPFFGSGIDPTRIDLDDWGKYMFTPEKFTGEKLYYWYISKHLA